MKKPQSPSSNRAKLIVLCGGEGSGKTSIINALKEMQMPDSSHMLIVSREPGGSPYAEDIRALMFKNPHGKNASAETMLGLFFASRSDHFDHTVLPALEKGIHVVSDRLDCCTYAHQIWGEKADHLKDLFWMMRPIYVKRKPDLYIMLDVDVKEGLRRVANRPGNNHIDAKPTEYHERVRQGYFEFFNRLRENVTDTSESHSVIVDANRSADMVQKDVFSIIQSLVA